MKTLAKIKHFLTTDIWRLRLKNYPHPKSFLITQLRIIVLAVRGFIEDKCKFRASALTLFSLLSIVPIIAVMFAISKGFGLEKRIESVLLQRMQAQEQVAQKIIEFANSLLENTSGGLIAGIGVAFLFWAVIKVLSNIEHAFNDIWGVKNPRTLARKFSDYLSMILLCPFLLIIASSVTVAINTRTQAILQQFPAFSYVGPLVLLLLKLLPFLTIWALFAFIFIFIPNTKVKFTSAFLAGIVAGTIFQIAQWLYISFQIGAAKYSAIYGSFAALPLFVIWVQISWLIVLFGAELAFAHQNVDTYEFEQDCLTVSPFFKKSLALLITQRLVKNFCDGQKPWLAADISQHFEIPIRLVRQILFDLTAAGILSQVKINDQKDPAYQPAIDVDKLTVKFVIESLDKTGSSDIPIAKSDQLENFTTTLDSFYQNMQSSPKNHPLKES